MTHALTQARAGVRPQVPTMHGLLLLCAAPALAGSRGVRADQGGRRCNGDRGGTTSAPSEEGYYQRTAEVAAGAAWRLGSDGNFDVPCLLVGVVMSVLHRFFSSGDGYVSVHRFHSLMAVELQAGGAELALAADDDGDSVEAVCDELRDRGHVQLHVIDMAFEDYYSEWNPLPHFDD